MFGGFKKYITFCLIAVISLASIGGVYANWNYAALPIEGQSQEIFIDMYDWAGIEILPTETEDGENHFTMIEALKTDLNKSGSTVQGLIDDRRSGRDEFGTMAVTGGDDLGGVISSASQNVSMLIYFPKTGTENVNGYDTYYVFTTSVHLGHSGASRYKIFSGMVNTAPGIHYFWDGGSFKHRIYEIYRTKLVKQNGAWIEDSVDVGSAEPCWYDENQADSAKNVTQIPSFEPSTYLPVKELPIATQDNPAFTYLNYSVSLYNSNASGNQNGKTFIDKGYEGQTVKAYPSTDRKENWYQLAPEMASDTTSGTVTLTLASEDVDCSLKVYGEDKSTFITENAGDGVVSFTATVGTVYYVVVSGDISIEYTITFQPN